jgi:UDP-N-acetylmuramate dehydrogenase
MKIKENILISELTTMRLGGPARYLLEIHTPEECHEAYGFAFSKQLQAYVLGGGSNVIGRDEGFCGVVLLNKLAGIEVLSQNEDAIVYKVASGEDLDAFVGLTVKDGWSGIEALSAIPGTVGGAVMQNAGAYGQEVSDVLLSVEVYDTADRQTKVLEQSQLNLSYRQSIFNSTDRGRYFILSATVRLEKGEMDGELFWSLQAYLNEHGIDSRKPDIIRDAVTEIRAHKLPDPKIEASSGSFFKNVTIREDESEGLQKKYPGIPIFQIGQCWEIASGWLIEQCGFKGQLLHGMRASSKTALILINESARSYQDLAQARQEIRSAVQKRFGFVLEQEPEELPGS